MATNFNVVKKPKRPDPLLDDDDEEEDDEDLEEDKKVSKKSSLNFNNPKKKMIMVMGIILGLFLLLLLILFLVSTFSQRVYSYEELEGIVENAAISYFKEHQNELPKEDGDIVEIDSSNLVVAEKMHDLSEYNTPDGVCSRAYVQVEKSGDDYLYSPYINCGESYATQELYKKVISKVVNEGYGLYQHNGEYAFRGETVDNYLQLENNLWRIVKVNKDNNLVLISNDILEYSYAWDNRYNQTDRFEAGINDYQASRIKESLDRIYKTPYEKRGEEVLSDKDKKYITSSVFCIGKRSATSEGKENVDECATTITNQRWGLLTLSDYMYASIDQNCLNSKTKNCKNYNYLTAVKRDWWLITADSDSTSKVYKISGRGNIESASANNTSGLRPVIVLNSKVMYKDGKGTLESPYTLR